MYKTILATIVGTSLAEKSSDCKEHSNSMHCGDCVRQGWNYCFNGEDGEEEDRHNHFESTCCKNDTCEQATDDKYTCSAQYTDDIYALSMCP